jgi:putative tryptophan/tyrosine transport system substrate-binding protein
MTNHIRRREFITLLGSAVATWPLAAGAQQQAMPLVGLLNGAASTSLLDAFRRGLGEAGYIEGRNVTIAYRSAEGNVDRLPALATELVNLRVAVIAAVGGDNAVRSAQAATPTIPIVFTTGGDPVETGFVASINRPGGNVTGATFQGSLVAPKQIALMRDVVPDLATIGLLLNPANPMTASVEKDVQTAAQLVGLKVIAIAADSAAEIETAFAGFAEHQIGALIIGSAVFFSRNLDRLVALSARQRIPAVFNNRDFATAGGLMSYGPPTNDSYRQAGIYVGRILKGDKPADLPVMQPVRFEFVINLKTARALGLTVPPQLLAVADDLIE